MHDTRPTHAQVIPLVDVLEEPLAYALVFPYMPLSLHDVIEHAHATATPIPVAELKGLYRDLLRALAYLHAPERAIMHRDVKPANILLDAKGTCRLGDFGLATCFAGRDRFSHQIASRWYRAPECLYGARRYTAAVDLWAAGMVCVYERGVPVADARPPIHCFHH